MNAGSHQTSADDPTGHDTLERFALVPAFNRWLFESMAPYCKGSLLEIGSGIGNISELLLECPLLVSLSDLREQYTSILQQRFGSHPRLDGIYQLNLSLPDFEDRYPHLAGRFDTILASNVIEHIENDRLAISNCRHMLKPHGRLIILVPAYGWLFNSLDTELGHIRRYNKKRLAGLLKADGMKVIYSRYFNSAAIPGWWFTGSLLKNKIIPKAQLSLYNKLVPFFRQMDKLMGYTTGLSVIAVGEN
ncbi:MAG TPA: class I SAM-dependent methyltransferase [Puia sp.]|nr:class I SAM-dependent methyltransferase [Puia sp.]